MEIEVKNYQFEGKVKTYSLVAAVIGLIAFVGSFLIGGPTVGWIDFMVSSLYIVTIAVSGIFVLAVSGVVRASWSTPYKRIFEAMTTFLPIGFVMMLITIGGLHSVFEWTHKDIVANDPILAGKAIWLNEPRYIGTMIAIFVIWIVLGTVFRRYSEKMDSKENGVAESEKLQKFSALALILFGLSLSVASWDWIMSVEPHWFSTIFGVAIFAGSFQTGIAFVTLVVLWLKKTGHFKSSINENHYHDLGKWMFGMSVFWAYMWISQYLLIWYANIPEETAYYVLRHEHWNGVFFFNLVINFILPFFILTTRKSKRSPKVLAAAAICILVGHFIDLFLMMAPLPYHHNDVHGVLGFGVIQIVQMVGVLGLFVFVVGSALSKRNLEVVNDPTFEEGIHLQQ